MPRRPALYALAVLPVAALAVARPTCDPPAGESDPPEGSYTRLTTDLAAGRATLAEVTANRAAWYADRPHALPLLRAAYPSASDREAVARAAVARAAARAAAGSDRAAVVARVAAEFRALFPDAGPLVFREKDGPG